MHAHGHDHVGHHHHHHHHAVSADADARMLAVALALNLGFMVVEVVVGVLAHSLALISDAGHMLTDAAAIGLALFAARLARRPSGGPMTFGYRRAEVLSAQFNGMTLVLLGAYVVIEAVMRLGDPPSVDAGLMLAVALAGAVVNLGAALALSRADRQNMNVEGAFLHNLYDLFSSLGAAVAAGVILLWGFDRADAIASLVIAVPMLRSGVSLLRVSGRVLMEASPRDIDPGAVGAALAAEPGVVEVHDLHVWEVSSGFAALSAHVVVAEHDDCHNIRWDLERVLDERFGITHTTLQIDHVHAAGPLRIEPGPGAT